KACDIASVLQRQWQALQLVPAAPRHRLGESFSFDSFNHYVVSIFHQSFGTFLPHAHNAFARAAHAGPSPFTLFDTRITGNLRCVLLSDADAAKFFIRPSLF